MTEYSYCMKVSVDFPDGHATYRGIRPKSPLFLLEQQSHQLLLFNSKNKYNTFDMLYHITILFLNNKTHLIDDTYTHESLN